MFRSLSREKLEREKNSWHVRSTIVGPDLPSIFRLPTGVVMLPIAPSAEQRASHQGTASATCSPASSVAVSDCRISRYTRSSPLSYPLVFHSAAHAHAHS